MMDSWTMDTSDDQIIQGLRTVIDGNRGKLQAHQENLVFFSDALNDAADKVMSMRLEELTEDSRWLTDFVVWMADSAMVARKQLCAE